MKQAESISHVWFAEEADALHLTSIHRLDSLYCDTVTALRRKASLEKMAENFVKKLTESLKALSGEDTSVFIDSLLPTKITEFLPLISDPSMVGFFQLEDKPMGGMVCIDQELVQLLVDILLGATQGTDSSAQDHKEPTSIVKILIEKVFKIFLEDFSFSIEEAPVELVFQKLEGRSKSLFFGKPSDSAFILKIKISVEDRAGFFDMVLPFELVENLFLKQGIVHNTEQDPQWKEAILKQMLEVNMTLEVILDEQDRHLSEVMEWKKGVNIPLLKGSDSLVVIACEGVPLFTAKVGHKGAQIAVSIEEII